jgi:predicted lipoprotein
VIVPRIESLSVDFNELLAGLRSDEDGTSRKYGFRHLSEGNHFNFAVKGTVKILSIDKSSSIGIATLDFAPFDGQVDCRMLIGTLFRGSTIRDIQNTISLNDFLNQTHFGQLNMALNNKVRDVVLKDIDFSQPEYIGAEAELLGAFTYDRDKEIEIIPLRLVFYRE